VISARHTRREWLQRAAALGAGALSFPRSSVQAATADIAHVAITLDLEMSRNFPTWDDTHWDYEKGNLNEETKRYAVEAARRVKAAGGVLHFFVVGRVLEQESVDWLQQLSRDGHPLGNHTYDHVNVTAKTVEDLQFRFKRSPWLLKDRSVDEALRENIVLTNIAMKSRLGIAPAGFRTPGGFADGLRDHPAIRAMLREAGFDWISSLYPRHPNTEPTQQPTAAVIDGIVAAQAAAQPFAYTEGLIEVPMSPISDIGAFRNGRWKLPWFLDAVRAAVDWAIDRRAVFDFLAHPSCLYVADPEFKTIDLICERVRAAGSRAAIVDLGTIAKRVVG